MSVFLLFILLFTVPVSPSSSPDRYTKSLLQPLQYTPREYLELAHPLPSDYLVPSCTHQILRHSFANTINSPPFSTRYSPPFDCPSPWSHVALDFRAECRGEQYDRIAGLWLGGAEILRTSTAEPTKCGIFWKVRKDITRYSPLLSRYDLNLTMMLENIVNKIYTGVYHITVTFLYYKENAVKVPSPNFGFLRDKQRVGGVRMWQGLGGLYEPPADFIIPISDRGDKGFWFRIDSDLDSPSKGIRIPRNTYRAVLELYVSFHGNDEFWYSNPPNSYIKTNNLTTERGNGAYREVYVTIDGKFVGSEAPFPVVFTGGVNPLFWEPVVGIGAFNLPSYDFDLTPFLGVLLDGKIHRFGFGVTEGIAYWLVNANLHLWVDRKSSKVQARSVVYNSPRLKIKRRSDFKLLDGSFKVEAERKALFVGWVKSSFGNLTTVFSQDYRLKNVVSFENNGAHKLVKQKVKAMREVTVANDRDQSVAHVSVRRRCPFSLITSTQPAPKKKKKNSYLLVTNVSHALSERYAQGDSASVVYNVQDSRGWMEVEDHSVLSGAAITRQSFSYRNVFGCFSRTVQASNGRLIRDNTTSGCLSSF